MTDLPNQKIQQIIPATGEVFGVQEQQMFGPVLVRVVAYALTEDAEGQQSVLPLVIDDSGDIFPWMDEIFDPGADNALRAIKAKRNPAPGSVRLGKNGFI